MRGRACFGNGCLQRMAIRQDHGTSDFLFEQRLLVPLLETAETKTTNNIRCYVVRLYYRL